MDFVIPPEFAEKVKGFNASQRAMFVATHMQEAVREMLELEKRRKRWIAEARRVFKPGARQPCVVCGRYESVTHAHHLVPLWKQAAEGVVSPIQDFVWLCPTHHAGVHLCMQNELHAKGFDFNEFEVLWDIAHGNEDWRKKIGEKNAA